METPHQAAERAAARWGEANPREGLSVGGTTTLRQRGTWIAKAKADAKGKAKAKAKGKSKAKNTPGGG